MDTHVVVWLAAGSRELSAAAAAAMREARSRGDALAISAVTLVEISFLAARNRLSCPGGLEAFLAEIEHFFIVVPITSRVCLRAVALGRRFPGDPADRIIAGTALAEGLSLITADRAIIRSRAVPTIW